MGKTSIEWTGYTWNPIRGTRGRHICQRISEGCKNCYAATINRRFSGIDYVAGADVPRLDFGALWLPLKWRKPEPVFVCSMTDLFWEVIPDEHVDLVFAVMAHCSAEWAQCRARRCEHEACNENTLEHHEPRVFQVLTKRAERALAYMTTPGRLERIRDAFRRLPWYGHTPSKDCAWPLPNVWLGVSVEDQQRADERIPLLLQTPAAVRWISAEPLLGPLTLNPWLLSEHGRRQIGAKPGLSWVVVGGESGPGARAFDLAWARQILEQCRAASVPAFMKQVGARPIAATCRACESTARCACVVQVREMRPVRLKDRKGGDPTEWPPYLYVREFPEVRA